MATIITTIGFPSPTSLQSIHLFTATVIVTTATCTMLTQHRRRQEQTEEAAEDFHRTIPAAATLVTAMLMTMPIKSIPLITTRILASVIPRTINTMIQTTHTGWRYRSTREEEIHQSIHPPQLPTTTTESMEVPEGAEDCRTHVKECRLPD